MILQVHRISSDGQMIHAYRQATRPLQISLYTKKTVGAIFAGSPLRAIGIFTAKSKRANPIYRKGYRNVEANECDKKYMAALFLDVCPLPALDQVPKRHKQAFRTLNLG